jgi:hypothetical protein
MNKNKNHIPYELICYEGNKVHMVFLKIITHCNIREI